MKRHLGLIVQFKFVWGLIFTAAILLYTTISMILGNTSIDFIVVWQLVAVTMVLTLIHYVIFGEYVMRSASTKRKLVVHFVLCYLALLISGMAAQIINISSLTHYIIFTVSYFTMYLFITMSLYIYYKATGEELNKKLATYKNKKRLNS